MDFGLTSDQQMLAASARDFLAAESPPATVRKIAADPHAFSPELFRKIVAQGWTGLLVPESYGGLGLTMLDAVVLLTELGRTLTPAPIFSSSVLATSLLCGAASAAQKKQWLPKLASGEVLATVAWLEEGDRLDPAGIALRPRRARTGLRLSGAKLFVFDAEIAHLYLVAVRCGAGSGEAGVTLLLVPRDTPGISVTPLPTIDVTRRVYEVKFDDVVVPPENVLGTEGKAWKHLARLLDVACVAIAAESQGGSEHALEMAVAYAKVREQFGRAIGSFQAVKHMLAEMFVRQEAARAGAYNGGATLDAPEVADVERAVAAAKITAGEAAIRNGRACIQVHGGMGFTWEVLAHYFFKRAWVLENLFGTQDEHAERIAELLEAQLEA